MWMMSAVDATGQSIEIELCSSYPVWRGLTLHSLIHATTYHCVDCLHCHESTMLATTTEGTVLCPGCYAAELSVADAAGVSP